MNQHAPPIDTDIADPQENGSATSQRRLAAGAGGFSGWLISGAFHVLMLLIMYGIYWVIKVPDNETPPVRPNLIASPEKKPTVPKPVVPDLKHAEVEIDSDVVAPTAPQVVDLPDPTPSTQDDSPDATPRGDPSEVADSALADNAGLYSSIGAGGDAKGLYGLRNGHGGDHRGGPNGPPPGTGPHIDSALRWFKKHQSANGMWDAVNFYKNCSEDLKCEPGAEAHGGPASYDVAMTAYALLCYLGDGYDQSSPNKYRTVVRRGLNYLLSVQKADGYIGERNYEHAVATMALCEAYVMGNDQTLHDPALRAVQQILAHENRDGAAADGAETSSTASQGMGWDYVTPDQRNDASVSGWNVMALKDALAAGLVGEDALAGPKHWLSTVWKKQNPDFAHLDPYTGEARFPYTYQTDSTATEIAAAPGPRQPGPNDHDLTCVGAACAVFLGGRAEDPMLTSMANYISNHYLPTSWPTNIYYMYYNTMTMFQVGGEKWRKWNAAIPAVLIKSQRSGSGCFAGSWDWSPNSFIGGETGRVLTTAYACLCLEVYWRYNHVLHSQ